MDAKQWKKLLHENTLNEDKKVKFKLICVNGGRVPTMNTDARSAEIRKGDIIQVYREDKYNYFGSPILKSGMRFKHDPGLSGKKIKNEFPDTSGMEVAIAKDKIGSEESDFWATFKKK